MYETETEIMFVCESEITAELLPHIKVEGYEFIVSPMSLKRSRLACFLRSDLVREFAHKTDLESQQEDIILLESKLMSLGMDMIN